MLCALFGTKEPARQRRWGFHSKMKSLLWSWHYILGSCVTLNESEYNSSINLKEYSPEHQILTAEKFNCCLKKHPSETWASKPHWKSSLRAVWKPHQLHCSSSLMGAVVFLFTNSKLQEHTSCSLKVELEKLEEQRLDRKWCQDFVSLLETQSGGKKHQNVHTDFSNHSCSIIFSTVHLWAVTQKHRSLL